MNGKGRMEPHADLRNAANVTRQMFIAFTDAGFDDKQALALVIAQMNQHRGGAA
ncbi:hypothetical protein K3888_11190 [Dietzia aurantiaca]|uniref:hypothetical protein n=1 Tax=Dietzia aurantiaca TaxID=983873 RepID=UPI001E370D00|nr:hypothetical protein [Dietzia aurantiaca]MCD2263262.1 hypothetical protein [Dietzia aurantiaca]